MSSKSVNPNNHSLSLAVKDIHSSKAFYEKLGFTTVEGAGSIEHNWIILENRHSKIGLFQNMFEENIITFIMESESIKDDKGPCHF
tara:strand:- start:6614 stop:6871 length:258 start_codon:yes stop_codon:yes gene_type:complete